MAMLNYQRVFDLRFGGIRYRRTFFRNLTEAGFHPNHETNAKELLNHPQM